MNPFQKPIPSPSLPPPPPSPLVFQQPQYLKAVKGTRRVGRCIIATHFLLASSSAHPGTPSPLPLQQTLHDTLVCRSDLSPAPPPRFIPEGTQKHLGQQPPLVCTAVSSFMVCYCLRRKSSLSLSLSLSLSHLSPPPNASHAVPSASPPAYPDCDIPSFSPPPFVSQEGYAADATRIQ